VGDEKKNESTADQKKSEVRNARKGKKVGGGEPLHAPPKKAPANHLMGPGKTKFQRETSQREKCRDNKL